MSIPNFQFWKEGKIVFNQPGAFPEEAFRDLIQQVIALDIKAAMAAQAAQQDTPESDS
jgi:thioredoxin reductase (NADPH)